MPKKMVKGDHRMLPLPQIPRTTRPDWSRAEDCKRDLLRKMKLTEKLTGMNFLKNGNWQSLGLGY